MAVEVVQQPTTPNATFANLLYVLSGSNATTKPQFRYVVDVYESGSNDYLTTIKAYPNTTGDVTIDIARELNDRLEYDLNWKTQNSAVPVDSVKTFTFKFGEEYSDTLNNPRTIYPGTVPYNLQVFPGTVYSNNGSYNFNTASIVANSNILSNIPQALYSVAPLYREIAADVIVLNKTDYQTITILKPDTRISAIWFDINNNFIYSKELTSTGKNFTTFGIGPQNLIDLDPATEAYFDDPTIYRVAINELGFPIFNYWLAGRSPLPVPNCNTDEYTRFAFINEYGFWDYYNVFNPLRREDGVVRSIYERSFVRYGEETSSYNISNRGGTQYRTDYTNKYTITTDYIQETTSKWLTELFESPEVFIQENGNFVPINITNTTLDWNMNQYRQKLFQYNIEFKYANQPQSR